MSALALALALRISRAVHRERVDRSDLAVRLLARVRRPLRPRW